MSQDLKDRGVVLSGSDLNRYFMDMFTEPRRTMINDRLRDKGQLDPFGDAPDRRRVAEVIDSLFLPVYRGPGNSGDPRTVSEREAADVRDWFGTLKTNEGHSVVIQPAPASEAFKAPKDEVADLVE